MYLARLDLEFNLYFESFSGNAEILPDGEGTWEWDLPGAVETWVGEQDQVRRDSSTY